MQNNKPEFTDRELELIEYSVSHLTGDGVFEKGFTSEELNDIFVKAKYYRLKDRICKGCNHITPVEKMVWDQPEYCVDCAPWYKDQDFVFTDKDRIYCKKCGEIHRDYEDPETFYQTLAMFTCRNCKAQYISKKEQERINRRNLEEKTKAARVELDDSGKIIRVYLGDKLMCDHTDSND